jgi:sigma-B regulation protein RsbU (phosphoserine phosphatase)
MQTQTQGTGKVDRDAVEDHGGIAVLRGGGDPRGWTGNCRMKILVADGDRVTRRLLEVMLTEWGYEVVLAPDGDRVWEILQGKAPPRLVLLDGPLPGISGPEICRRLRALPTKEPTYVILLTANDTRRTFVASLRDGADDYVTKPLDAGELKARLNTAFRIVGLQRDLADRVHELEASRERVRQLQGLVPICA